MRMPTSLSVLNEGVRRVHRLCDQRPKRGAFLSANCVAHILLALARLVGHAQRTPATGRDRSRAARLQRPIGPSFSEDIAQTLRASAQDIVEFVPRAELLHGVGFCAFKQAVS